MVRDWYRVGAANRDDEYAGLHSPLVVRGLDDAAGSPRARRGSQRRKQCLHLRHEERKMSKCQHGCSLLS
ncbi:hypothetical protein AAZX31_10G028600 [Glycine max]